MSFSEKLIAITFLTLILAPHAIAAEKLPVCVSILPQKYFANQIGGELVEIQVMVPPGASPATYEPKPRQMAALSAARIYFTVGVPFENAWMQKISAANPEMKVVHTDHGIEKLPMQSDLHHGEEAYPHGDGKTEELHGHGILDPHIWLSPPLVKKQAHTILSALIEADPSHKEMYTANYKLFASKIDVLDEQLKKIFAHKRNLQFIVFHPSWGYFAKAYGLQQVPIEVEGKSPKPAQLKELIETVRARGIKIIFVQPQFSTKSAELVAKEIDGEVAFADPLAENWLANLKTVADKFAAVLK